MSRTVLVVDDNKMNRMVLQNILCDDYSVIEAENGEVALRMLREAAAPVSAVLLDLAMPVMDGFQTLREMNMSPVLSQIPVIVTTGAGDETSELRALELGATDYVTKPYDPLAILKRLANLIKLRESSLRISAMRDDRLTGLLNREPFFFEASQLIEQAKSGEYAMCALDIDRFSLINDGYGSAKGDEVLKRVAETLAASIGSSGGLCCRMTADNFAFLCRAKDDAAGEALLSALAGLNVDLALPPMTFSLGRCSASDPSCSASSLYDHACLAKACVKGRYDKHIADYDPSMLDGARKDQRIVDEMRSALSSGQFEAWYQPQYDNYTGALVGAEALARWRHPSRGLIPPCEFIPVFERSGFIYELDKYIWESACAFISRSRDGERRPLPVSVNISRFDLFRVDICDVLTSLVQKYSISRDMLRLEITESAFTTDPEAVTGAVQRLAELGFTVEIDDFGSGYSSLNILKDVPAGVIKLDMRFLEGTNNLDRGGSIIESVVRMARRLDMSIIAEGVETGRQAEYLRSIGCRYSQGYYFGRPMQESDYITLAKGQPGEAAEAPMCIVDELDSNEFWDPNSVDTLIFNSFVGDACVLEYAGGTISMVRSTDPFEKTMAEKGVNAGDLMRLDFAEYLDDAGKRTFDEAVNTSISTRKSVTREYVMRGLPGCADKLFIRCIQRVIANSDGRALVYSINEDVTSWRETEAMHRALTDQLAAIMANIDGGITVAEPDDAGRLHTVYCNDRFYSIIGYTKNEYENEITDLFQLVLPEDIRDAETACENTVAGRGKCDLICRIRRRNGDIRSVRCHGSAISIGGKNAVLRVIYDVTDTLADAEKLALLADNIPGGIASFVMTKDGVNVTYMNEGAERLIGYSFDEFRELAGTALSTTVFADDLPNVISQFGSLMKTGSPVSCVCRILDRTGKGFKWVFLRGVEAGRSGDSCNINMVMTDVTERQELIESLTASEEQFRIAADMSGVVLGRYDVKTGLYRHHDPTLIAMGLPRVINDVPEGFIEKGLVGEGSEDALREFYRAIKRGDQTCRTEAQLMLRDGKPHWCRLDASLIFDPEGRPSQAVIVTTNIDHQREKELIYKRWQQSLRERRPEDYTLYRCNLSRDTSFDTVEGELLRIEFQKDERASFNDHTREYAFAFVHPDDRDGYIDTLDSDSLLAGYYRGRRVRSIDYRELSKNGDTRWLRLSIELVEYPDSHEVEAYLMYENIDDAKKKELSIRELAENDPLTGVLNRTTLRSRVNIALKDKPGTLFMLDVDGFKNLNDSFGHAAGDQALIEIASRIGSALRRADLLGRLGGDEFLFYLPGAMDPSDIESKARQICGLLRKQYSPEVGITASIGIAVAPKDGTDFDSLYRKADAALYAVKDSGRNSFSLYRSWMGSKTKKDGAEAIEERVPVHAPIAKKRMLIVEDNSVDMETLCNMFGNDYNIIKAKSGREALIRLRHFGSAISVMLLDLFMPDMDGFAVLERMSDSPEIRAIPAIVVSGSGDMETTIRAVRCGASDYVTKPVDPDILRVRVDSAISRAENERLRAQNSYLSMQRDETAMLRAALFGEDVALVEYNWKNGSFTYDPSVSAHIYGDFDERELWLILLSDFTAESKDVMTMQRFVYDIANDRTKTFGSVSVRLKTPSGVMHRFRMCVTKLVDELRLTDKLILTFRDIEGNDRLDVL